MSTNLFDEGIDHFNASRYFEAHEVWEDLWRQSEGDVRDHVQGLIHAAVGLYHLQRGNWLGARNQLRKCLTKLRRHADGMAGIDNRELQLRVAEIVEALDSTEAAGAASGAFPGARISRL